MAWLADFCVPRISPDRMMGKKRWERIGHTLVWTISSKFSDSSAVAKVESWTSSAGSDRVSAKQDFCNLFFLQPGFDAGEPI
jgi:hypothetical protein